MIKLLIDLNKCITDFPEIFNYEVDRNAPLPTGEPVDKLAYEAYPEDYHGPKEDMLSLLKSLFPLELPVTTATF